MKVWVAGLRILLSIGLAASLWSVLNRDADADSVTFQVSGTLVGFDGPVLSPLAIGQPYSATFVVNSSASATPVFGGGNDYFGAITSASFSIGPYSGTLANPSATTIRVLDNFFGNSDFYGAYLGDITFGTPGVISAPPVTGPLGDLNPVLFAMIGLQDFLPPLDGLSSSQLPLAAPDISKFDSASWVIEFRSADESLFGRARGSIQSFTTVGEAPELVAVDVLPEGCPNPLAVTSGGLIAVAILGTDDLDVSTIDVASLKLGGSAPVRSAVEDVGTPFEPFVGKSDAMDCNELGPDGFADLALKFDKQQVIAAMGAEFAEGDTLIVQLTGSFSPEAGGGDLRGEDVLVIRIPEAASLIDGGE